MTLRLKLSAPPYGFYTGCKPLFGGVEVDGYKTGGLTEFASFRPALRLGCQPVFAIQIAGREHIYPLYTLSTGKNSMNFQGKELIFLVITKGSVLAGKSNPT